MRGDKQVGLFDVIKNGYDKDDDLKDLEELMYDNSKEAGNKMSINDMIKSFELNESDKTSKEEETSDYKELLESMRNNEEEDGPSGLTEKTRKQQESVQREEEKYDNLLNTLQTQTLIMKVDDVTRSKGKDSQNSKIKSTDPDTYEKSENSRQNINTIIETDIDRELELKQAELDAVSTTGFNGDDIGSFIKSQCDICEEAARFIENARVEYDSVTDYYEDIQKIENAPADISRELVMVADRVDNLSVDRRILNTPDSRLSNNAYRNMEMYEAEFPDAVAKLRNTEDDRNTIARDIRMVKTERSMYRMEAKELVNKQLRIKGYAQLICGLLAAIFAVFMVIMAVTDGKDNIGAFITVVLLAGVMALGLYAYLKSIERKVYVTEIKLNKATALLNKIKIKYVNAANVLDYQYNKYNVKSAYELEQKYQAYIEMKEEQKKMLEVTGNLTSAEADLMHILGRLGVIDTHVWIAQVKAILNPKEMVEVRHNLSVRRQKLRKQIEYNENRIEDAKNNIKNITRNNPAYAKDAMEILEKYLPKL